MKDIKSALGGILVLILIGTGIFSVLLKFTGEVMKFFLWLFTISMAEFGISQAGEIFVKVATFAISYILVGLLFGLVDGFKGKGDAMSIAYFITSTLLGFGLSVIIMFLESNIVVISWIILGIVITILFTIGLILLLKQKKSKNTQEV